MEASDRPSAPTVTGTSTERVSEDIFVRSYDASETYRLTVVLAALDGEERYRSTYHLRPGQAVSELGAVRPGEYQVRVAVDGTQRASRPCRIGDSVSRTALVEVGNGIVSVSQGLEQYHGHHDEQDRPRQ
jgi:hypothetical protein